MTDEHPEPGDLYARGMREAFRRPESSEETPGGQVDGYDIIRKIGEGGMGIVYEAQQSAPRRRVAIKMIRGGRFVGDESIRMFRREAHALGILDHPGIARILEAGTTDDGAHYLVMDHIEGVNLSTWITSSKVQSASSRRGLQARLEIFLQLGRAVTYAHQQGIVHRDLKPGNVLVNDEDGMPRVKVLDFGLARMLDRDATFFTESTPVQGTLAYMSPEQMDGGLQRPDVRSDVYSLGVMLFETLTGDLPIHLPETSLAAAARVVTDTPPTTLRNAWPGGKAPHRDLSTIVSKALEKRVDDRYQSVSEFAEDLQRFLDGRPIVASAPNSAERMWRFVLRNKVACLSALVAASVLLGFTIALANQVDQTTKERDRANLEASSAERIIAFLSDMYAASSPNMALGETVTVRTFLDRTARRIAVTLKGEPRIRARIMTLVGGIYRDLGLDESSRQQLEAALAIRREIQEPYELADALVQLASTVKIQGDFERAEELLAEAMSIAEETEDTGSRSNALVVLSDLHTRTGDYPAAVRAAEQALEAHRETGRTSDPSEARHWIALGHARRFNGEYSAAETAFDQALSILIAAHGELHSSVASALTGAAILRDIQDRRDEAEPLFRRVLAIRKQLLEPSHPDVALAKLYLASCLSEQRPPSDEALDLALEALEVLERTLGERSSTVAGAHMTLGLIYKHRLQLDDSIDHLQQAAAIDERRLGPSHPSVATKLNNLGSALRTVGRLEEAEVAYRRSKEIKEQIYPAGHPKLITINHNLGNLYLHLRKPEDAWAPLSTALEIKSNVFGPEHPRLAGTILHMATCKEMLGEREAALGLLRRAFELGADPADSAANELLGELRELPEFSALVTEFQR